MKNTRYIQKGHTLNRGPKKKNTKNTMEECRSFCEKNYPDEAKYFSWSTATRKPSKNKLVCRCKKSNEGMRTIESVISGNLFAASPMS